MASADIAVARVRWRAHQGSHDVAEDKIRARYVRNQALIRQAAVQVDRARIFDSSKAHAPPRWLLSLRRGQVEEVCADLPAWLTTLDTP